MAAGARPNFFGVPGAAEHAFPLYSVADAERLRLHLQDAVGTQRAPRPDSDGSSRRRRRGRRSDRASRSTGAVVGADRCASRDTAGSPNRAGSPWSTAGTALLGAVLRASPTSTLSEADRAGRRHPPGGRRQRRARRPGRARRRRSDRHPNGRLGRRRVGSADRPDAGPTPGRGGRLDVLPDLAVDGLPGCRTPSGDVANIPGRRVNRCRSSGPSRSSRGAGRRTTSCASRRENRRSRSTTRTRASWR